MWSPSLLINHLLPSLNCSSNTLSMDIHYQRENVWKSGSLTYSDLQMTDRDRQCLTQQSYSDWMRLAVTYIVSQWLTEYTPRVWQWLGGSDSDLQSLMSDSQQLTGSYTFNTHPKNKGSRGVSHSSPGNTHGANTPAPMLPINTHACARIKTLSIQCW